MFKRAQVCLKDGLVSTTYFSFYDQQITLQEPETISMASGKG